MLVEVLLAEEAVAAEGQAVVADEEDERVVEPSLEDVFIDLVTDQETR